MAKSVEEISSEFYCAVGRATTAWQLVEDGMRDVFSRIVFCTIVGTANHNYAAHPKALWIVSGIFYSSTNIRARLDMIGEMIDQTVADTTLSDGWGALRNKILRIYKRRNTLAHSHAWGNDVQGITSLRPDLFVRNARSMNLSQILAAELSFRKTSDQLIDFANALNRHLVGTYPPKSVPKSLPSCQFVSGRRFLQ